jgi:hypothetical protein
LLTALDNKMPSKEQERQHNLLDASILAPLAIAMGGDASSLTAQALIDATCLKLRKENAQPSRDIVLQLETSLADRDLVINDLSSKIDSLRDELRTHQSALSASKEREASALVQSSSLQEQVHSLSDALRIAKAELSATVKTNGDENELRNAKAQIQK